MDGNEAAARIAYAASEVVAIYPITPASPMGELSDDWASARRKNVFGQVPRVVEMQSEGGAAGTVHGALSAGALTTTFTSSQGLLLMIPNMYKIAGELTPAVIHVAARALATHALSIFGDHADVMATRASGFGMLFSSSVQEAHDQALVAHAATLHARVPFLHIFDGFRTSHEVNGVEVIPDAVIRSMLDEAAIERHRARSLSPDHPSLRGTAQNPDVFFQAREACNPYYLQTPGIIESAMKRLSEQTGRSMRLFDYDGHPEPDQVIVMMGSGLGAAREAVRRMVEVGERVGVVGVRLFRPFSMKGLLDALPPSVRKVAVLDRTKEPGAPGEPLYLDVLAALSEARRQGLRQTVPEVVGGRYGLSSKEFTPRMATGVFSELRQTMPRNGFTVGIVDDVTHLSINYDKAPEIEPSDVVRAVFYGLGADGTVGANKNSVKIIGEETDLHAQGYFVYDSKKSGAVTVSHLRFSPRPIESTYLVQSAQFVACHQFNFLEQRDVLSLAAEGATFLLNSPHGAEIVWDKLPEEVQRAILEKKLRLFVIDAVAVAEEAGLAGRINTVMQTCFFALFGALPRDEAIAAIKRSIEKTYKKSGQRVLDANVTAVDAALAHLHEVKVPLSITSEIRLRPAVPPSAPDFVTRVTGAIIRGDGDKLPVSALPVDGAFPTGTAQYEKRSIALEIPIWDSDICIQCGFCALVCPHAAIRTKAFPNSDEVTALGAVPYRGKELIGPDLKFMVQVAPDDCTGCGVCVDVCPAKSKSVAKHKAIDMSPKDEHIERERPRFEAFLAQPAADRTKVRLETVKGSQLAEPLFEYSGACAGCGETPYLKLMTQLLGDRAVVANATGCSSIFGGNLPTTPWSQDSAGRGPAWSNSLFEDNAEFGLGMRLALKQQSLHAEALLTDPSLAIPGALVAALRAPAPILDEPAIAGRREAVAELKRQLSTNPSAEARRLSGLADHLVPKSVWIVGGDGWAYDIGFGGLDHVLTSGEDLNILVLDTEVYSNTGGQASKATPRGAVAKFAAAGKPIGKKDLGMIAMGYGNVYVAQIALGANMKQTLQAMREAASYPGVSLVIAYATCIAHGIDMSTSMSHMKEAEAVGHWPLYRFDPRHSDTDAHPFQLDSKKPSRPFKTYAEKEARYAMLQRADPERASRLAVLAQKDIDERWSYYEQLAGLERHTVTEEQG